MGRLLASYLSLHIGLALATMMYTAFTTGVTDYGGEYGFLPSVDITVYDLGQQFAATDPGTGASDLRDILGFVARLPGIVLGLFTFNYPILQAGDGFFSWFGIMFQVIGSIASIAFTVWLLRLVLSTGLVSNAWFWIVAGVSMGGLSILNIFGIG